MKKFLNIFILVLLSFKTKSLLPPEEREKLLNKYARKISPESFQSKDSYLFSNYLDNDSINYNAETINTNLGKYNFPKQFNFLTTHSMSAKVKNQGSCKCGWALSAATALSYRFKLKKPDSDIDLSPQYSISCYLPDCKGGNNLIDPQLNLIKNGTVTEECLPYSSGSGTITDTCPEKCKNGSDLKIYHSQNAYSTESLIKDINSYYNIVTLIIDQLINKGPVVSRISLYQDFGKLMNAPMRCPNEIYKYDGTSPLISRHALVIIGYNYSDTDSGRRYYWIVQNSMGGDKCPDGLMKVEFGQVQIESVAFSEPYLEEEGIIPTEIKLKYNKIEDNCDLDISSEDLSKWKNTLEVSFESEDKKRNFNIQCGALSSEKVEKKIGCYYEEKYYLNPMQDYIFKEYKSLGKDNTFTFISNSEINNFTFYGYYNISSRTNISNTFFVSEEGSKVFLFFHDDDANKDFLPPIYSKNDNTHPLSNCKKSIIKIESENYNLLVCELKNEEINNFDEYNEGNKNQMVYDILCGQKQETKTYAYKLDKTKYPIFKYKNINIDKNGEISSNTLFELVVDVEGTIPTDYKDQNFMGFTYLEKNNANTSYTMMCKTGIPNQANAEHKMTCDIQINGGETKQYDKLYILPYLIPTKIVTPYEVILTKAIEIKSEPKTEEFSQNLQLSLIMSLLIILLI